MSAMPADPATRIRAHLRALLMLTATIALLASVAVPALAGPPTRSELTVLSVRCVSVGEHGTAVLHVIHEDPATIGFGATVEWWPSGTDPEDDPPAITGFDPDVVRAGERVTGQVELHVWGEGGGPGQGLAGDPDVVGWAAYGLDVTVAGVVGSHDQKWPTWNQLERENRRFRTTGERYGVTGSAVLTLPGIGPLEVQDCAGDEVAERTVLTEPEAIVSHGRYPIQFSCAYRSSGATLQVTAAAFETQVAIVPDGHEEAVAFGSWFVDETRDRLSGRIPLVDRAGEDIGDAALEASIRTVDRGRTHQSDAHGRWIWHVEELLVEGTVTFDQVSYDLRECDALRFRGHTIHHPSKGKTDTPADTSARGGQPRPR
jgi:hypothetical protein